MRIISQLRLLRFAFLVSTCVALNLTSTSNRPGFISQKATSLPTSNYPSPTGSKVSTNTRISTSNVLPTRTYLFSSGSNPSTRLNPGISRTLSSPPVSQTSARPSTITTIVGTSPKSSSFRSISSNPTTTSKLNSISPSTSMAPLTPRSPTTERQLISPTSTKLGTTSLVAKMSSTSGVRSSSKIPSLTSRIETKTSTRTNQGGSSSLKQSSTKIVGGERSSLQGSFRTETPALSIITTTITVTITSMLYKTIIPDANTANQYADVRDLQSFLSNKIYLGLSVGVVTLLMVVFIMTIALLRKRRSQTYSSTHDMVATSHDTLMDRQAVESTFSPQPSFIPPPPPVPPPAPLNRRLPIKSNISVKSERF